MNILEGNYIDISNKGIYSCSIFIENGKIIEDGKHGELLKAKQGTYQKLWGIQAGSFN